MAVLFTELETRLPPCICKRPVRKREFRGRMPGNASVPLLFVVLNMVSRGHEMIFNIAASGEVHWQHRAEHVTDQLLNDTFNNYTHYKHNLDPLEFLLKPVENIFAVPAVGKWYL